MKAKAAISACALLLAAEVAVAAVTGPKPDKYAAVVIDSDSGVVLYERNADFTRYPASLTKMMTLYLTFEAMKAGRIKLTDQLAVSEHAASRDPSRLGLSPGGRLTLENAVRAMTTKSANDAASVVAEALAKGSESRFAEMMTAKARELGMKHSTFRNASGLPESGHVTSAMDLAILARALVRDFPQEYRFFSVSAFEFGGKRYPNQNRFLHTYAGADGIKTGYIDSSGYNLAASAVRGGKRLIAVVLGGDSARWTREYASGLLDIAYASIDPRLVVLASVAPAASPASSTASAAPAATTATTGAAAAPTATTVAAPATKNAAGAAATTGAKTWAEVPVTGPAPRKAPAAAPPVAAFTAVPSAGTEAPGAPREIPGPERSTATDSLLGSTSPDTAAARKNTTRRVQPSQQRRAARAGQWAIQIGLYGDRASAERTGEAARQRLRSQLGNAPLMVASAGDGAHVSPRFEGLSESEARQACTQLQRVSLPCVVVPPGRPMIVATN